MASAKRIVYQEIEYSSDEEFPGKKSGSFQPIKRPRLSKRQQQAEKIDREQADVAKQTQNIRQMVEILQNAATPDILDLIRTLKNNGTDLLNRNAFLTLMETEGNPCNLENGLELCDSIQNGVFDSGIYLREFCYTLLFKHNISLNTVNEFNNNVLSIYYEKYIKSTRVKNSRLDELQKFFTLQQNIKITNFSKYIFSNDAIPYDLSLHAFSSLNMVNPKIFVGSILALNYDGTAWLSYFRQIPTKNIDCYIFPYSSGPSLGHMVSAICDTNTGLVQLYDPLYLVSEDNSFSSFLQTICDELKGRKITRKGNEKINWNIGPMIIGYPQGNLDCAICVFYVAYLKVHQLEIDELFEPPSFIFYLKMRFTFICFAECGVNPIQYLFKSNDSNLENSSQKYYYNVSKESFLKKKSCFKKIDVNSIEMYTNGFVFYLFSKIHHYKKWSLIDVEKEAKTYRKLKKGLKNEFFEQAIELEKKRTSDLNKCLNFTLLTPLNMFYNTLSPEIKSNKFLVFEKWCQIPLQHKFELIKEAEKNLENNKMFRSIEKEGSKN